MGGNTTQYFDFVEVRVFPDEERFREIGGMQSSVVMSPRGFVELNCQHGAPILYCVCFYIPSQSLDEPVQGSIRSCSCFLDGKNLVNPIFYHT